MATKKTTSGSSARSPARRPPQQKSGSAKKTRAPRSATPAKRDKCFVICPFGGWHDEYHREIFCAAIEAAGLEPVRSDDLFRSSNIVHDVWHLVATSRVLLADLTGKNPNVFYELGLAHAARKPVVLVTQSMEDVPFDLRALRVITYDVAHPSWAQILRKNIESALRETLEAPERSVLPTFLLEDPAEQPKVSADERRFLAIQQQLDSLRSEMRSRRMGLDPAEPIGPAEAERLLEQYVQIGMPPDMIAARLKERGAPEWWVDAELERAGLHPRSDAAR